MLVKNTTPFPVGFKASARKRPELVMTLVVRGKFRIRPDEVLTPIEGELGQGFLSDETFAEGDEARLGPLTYAGDFADYKPSAEVLLVGDCHTPEGRPLVECPVVFAVGGLRKVLRVVGRRFYTGKLLGPLTTDPEPFTRMDLSWRNAFGGPGYAKNPVGKGHGTDELPSVVGPRDVVDSRDARLEPAGFGPVPSTWPARAARRGAQYGKGWRAPFYADDFDPRYFQVAPPDQWLPGYLRGDEELFFQNLHPHHPILRCRLPGLRIRALMKDARGDFFQANLALDTLLASPDEETVTLTWRALMPVREDDLADAKTLFVWSEPLEGPALPEREPYERLEAFERDPADLEGKLPPGLLEAAERYRREKRGEEVSIEGEDAAELDPVSRLVRKKLGPRFAAEEQAEIRKAMKPLTADPAGLAELAARVEAIERASADEPPVPVTGKPGVAPNTGLRRRMREVLEEAARLRRDMARAEIPADRRRELQEKIAELEAFPHDPRWKQVDPTYAPPVEAISTDEPGPGKNLAERDFTGQDLAGLDLTGANLAGAILTRANLTGARLAGANLTNAVLFRTNLNDADLSGADLTRVNAAHASAEGTSFSGAVIEQAYFEGARLARASFEGAKGEYAVFKEADLARVTFRGADLFGADFSSAALDGASLGAARLVACNFVEAGGEKVSLRGATLDRSSFDRARLADSSFIDARGERVNFAGASLERADFGFCALTAAMFTEAAAADAVFYGANVKESRFYRANLARANFSAANLMAADLGKARLEGARFLYASLYDAKLLGASLEGADFTEANLSRATVDSP